MEAATTCMYFTYIFVALVTAVNGLMGLTGKGSGKDPSVTVHYLIMMIMMMMIMMVTYFFGLIHHRAWQVLWIFQFDFLRDVVWLILFV